MTAPNVTSVRRTTACAVVLDEDDRVLLQRRSDNGRWCLPGGAIEPGETAEQAVVREAHEETGYVIVAERLVGVYSLPEHTTITYPDGNTVSYVALTFQCRVVGGSASLSDETIDVTWCSADALPSSVSPGHRQRIEDALARQREAFIR